MAQKEGWSKAEKLKNRNTTQGTLVFCADKSKNQAALIEVNKNNKITFKLDILLQCLGCLS